MVVETERDDGTWYEREERGVLLETNEEAEGHERRREAAEPSYVQ